MKYTDFLAKDVIDVINTYLESCLDIELSTDNVKIACILRSYIEGCGSVLELHQLLSDFINRRCRGEYAKLLNSTEDNFILVIKLKDVLFKPWSGFPLLLDKSYLELLDAIKTSPPIPNTHYRDWILICLDYSRRGNKITIYEYQHLFRSQLFIEGQTGCPIYERSPLGDSFCNLMIRLVGSDNARKLRLFQSMYREDDSLDHHYLSRTESNKVLQRLILNGKFEHFGYIIPETVIFDYQSICSIECIKSLLDFLKTLGYEDFILKRNNGIYGESNLFLNINIKPEDFRVKLKSVSPRVTLYEPKIPETSLFLIEKLETADSMFYGERKYKTFRAAAASSISSNWFGAEILWRTDGEVQDTHQPQKRISYFQDINKPVAANLSGSNKNVTFDYVKPSQQMNEKYQRNTTWRSKTPEQQMKKKFRELLFSICLRIASGHCILKNMKNITGSERDADIHK